MTKGVKEDLRGQKIGKLTIVDRKRELVGNKSRTFYYCKCDCGNEKWMRSDNIKHSNASCGCTKVRFKDMTNKRFGMLTAIKVIGTSKNNGNLWRCKCDCGNFTDVPLSSLISGATNSCGCHQKKIANENIKKAFKKFKEKNIVENTNVAYLMLEKPIKSNKSGVTGVCFNTKMQRWTAQITFKGERIHLGTFINKEDAIKSRKEAEEKLHKGFLKEKRLID